MIQDYLDIEQANSLVTADISVANMTSEIAQSIVDELTERMRYAGGVNFILNMSAVEFLDSSCVGALVGFLQDLEHVRGRVALAQCQPNVAFLFKVTKLDTAIPLFDEIEDAVEELG